MNTSKPFDFNYSDNFWLLLNELNCNLIVSTYQSGKVAVFNSLLKQQEGVRQFLVSFPRPMGIAVAKQKIAIATQNKIHVFSHHKELAAKYPPEPNVYSDIYIPEASYFTGALDVHDIEWGKQGLWGVNTRFSCLCLFNEDHSFQPMWRPKFIEQLEPTDQCHLNGMAMVSGVPRYATAFSQTSTPKGWRDMPFNSGCVIDLATAEPVLEGLAMPHSPRVFDDKLYLLQSATGELIQADLQTGRYEVVTKLNGFARGMSKIGDYVFIGFSKLRKSSKAFGKLPIAKSATECGVSVIHLPTGKEVAGLRYKNTTEEIFDVKILPDHQHSMILDPESKLREGFLTSPIGDFWVNPGEE